jgi:hypothetical protein
MAPPKLTTLGPELLREIRWTIDRVKRMVGGDLRDDDRRPPAAPDDYIVKTPSGGIPKRVGARISSALCNVQRLVPVVGDDTKFDHEDILEDGSPWQLRCLHISKSEDAAGDTICVSSRLKDGRRYIHWEDCEAD